LHNGHPREERMELCCILSGGHWGNPNPTEGNKQCTAPAPEAENVPQPPSNPLIPVLRGPNSGTLG
jgi:hypothetical protein